MAIDYSWKVTQLTKKSASGLDNVIVHTRWKLTGTDTETGTSGDFPGATPFELDPANTGSFVAYEDLTEDIIIGWLQNVVVDDYWDHVTGSILQKISEIDDAEVRIEEEQLPWVTGSSTPDSGSL